jgi:flagellar biosynthesis protein FliR
VGDMLFNYETVLTFLLAFLRISGLFFLMPFFSRSAVNSKVRLFFGVIVTFVVFPVIPKDLSGIDIGNIYIFVSLAIIEIAVGVILGYMVILIFSVIQITSEIYSTQMGFNMVNVFDPMAQIQVPILGQFNNLFFMSLFFISGMHGKFLEVVIKTFYMYPIGHVGFHQENMLRAVLDGFQYSFLAAMQLALPILGMLLLIDIILGIMSRIAPQMNVFFIGMPLKIMVGLILLISMVPYMMVYFNMIIEESYVRIGKFVIHSFLVR